MSDHSSTRLLRDPIVVHRDTTSVKPRRGRSAFELVEGAEDTAQLQVSAGRGTQSTQGRSEAEIDTVVTQANRKSSGNQGKGKGRGKKSVATRLSRSRPTHYTHGRSYAVYSSRASAERLHW